MRATLADSGDWGRDLDTTANLRRDLWAHAPVAIDPDHPLYGTHRDYQGRAYIEFSTPVPDAVRRVLREHGYTDRVELTESNEPLGRECLNRGNIAGPVRPSVCPNCDFRDVSPCPVCAEEVPREQYIPLGGYFFRCPRCRNRVRFRFNSPMFLLDRNFNPPLIVIDEVATPHEV
jgi:hypothetical protein